MFPLPRRPVALPAARPKQTPLLMLALALGLSVGPAPARAEGRETIRFTASILGLTAGRMTLAINRRGEAYAVTGQTVSAGLAGLFSPFRVTNRVRGTEREGRFLPERYQSQSDGERRGRGAEMTYRNGVPSIVALEAEDRPGAPVLDPASQAGKVDPLTLTYALLRDTDREGACTLSLDIFDGHRAARLTLGQPRVEDDGLVCQGVYRRVDGYPPQDLAERQDFPFTITYAPLPDGRLRPMELVLDSLFGTARLTRED